ncbi:hypothetical protein HD599_003240 [Conyzicola lurida]|uniref:Uncharacterized protein n=1 Tax=Conyzicola lurida TaxID=1172621 RepID=A0A841ANZ3_9MICO|nr:hypothetical protein [Conyzicola lurida]MBB5844917.1 hypothetical protein [Conyzicola lurida]
MASFVDRNASMEQRATILIGAASVVGALQVDSTPSGWLIANLLLSFVAAICGVVVVFPRKGDALDVRKMRTGMSKMPVRAGREKLLDIKLEVLEADEKWLMTRGKWARTGFIALSLSIALALLGAVVPNDEPQPSKSPAPTPTSTVGR